MKGENTTKNTEMCDFSDFDMNWFLHTVNIYKVDFTSVINVGGGGGGWMDGWMERVWKLNHNCSTTERNIMLL
jgi:hypothetical protein